METEKSFIVENEFRVLDLDDPSCTYIVHSSSSNISEKSASSSSVLSGCTPPAVVEWQQVNHAVLLVGYGEDTIGGETVKYWIAQNSWGERWGEGGYFRIERGMGEASIESLAVSVEPMV